MVNALFIPFAVFATTSRLFATTSRRAMTTSKLQASSLSSLLDESGKELSGDTLASKLANKRVALYFSAGWCPMCTSFEPALESFRKEAADKGNPIEIVYVSSDRSEADQTKRAGSMDMLSVPFEQTADFKQKYKIWAGSEVFKFGLGRQSGVPALVVLDKNAEEVAFVAAEAQGAKALDTWPIDDPSFIWGV
jgi:nucleoredoxin